MAFPRPSAPPDPFPLIARLRAGGIVAAFALVTPPLMLWQWLLLRLASLGFGIDAARRFPMHYHRMVARLFGIRIRVIGEPVTGEGVLILANHTSWIDITLFSALLPLSFVAKAEVARWPFFGTLARLQRTVFVERERRAKTGDVADAIGARLAAGDCLVLFPEGTSHDGNIVLPFKSALLGASEARGPDGTPVKVQPVSAAYAGCQGMPMGREIRPFFAWYGDMEMMPHLWEALKCGPLDITVQFHPPVSLATMSRKELAALAHAQIQAGVSHALAGRV